MTKMLLFIFSFIIFNMFIYNQVYICFTEDETTTLVNMTNQPLMN